MITVPKKTLVLVLPFLKPLKANEFTVKDSFHFSEEIFDQQHDLYMGSFDVDSLFTKIPLEETIKICTNKPFKEFETVESLSKTEFKKLLSLATKESHFFFCIYKQIDVVVMGFLLRPFLVFHKKVGLNVVHRNIDHYIIEDTLMIYLFY